MDRFQRDAIYHSITNIPFSGTCCLGSQNCHTFLAIPRIKKHAPYRTIDNMAISLPTLYIMVNNWFPKGILFMRKDIGCGNS